MLNIWNIKYNSLEYITDTQLKKSFEEKTDALQEFKDLDFFIYKGPSIIFLTNCYHQFIFNYKK